jgi:hypothetical protein
LGLRTCEIRTEEIDRGRNEIEGGNRNKKGRKENETVVRKLNFLKKMQRKILQGGYQISSDTMLRNMTSMKVERKS